MAASTVILSGAGGMWRSSVQEVAFTAHQAVKTEATFPNSSDCFLRASKSLRQSTPSAMATARRASSDDKAVPARGTGLLPSLAVSCRYRAKKRG